MKDCPVATYQVEMPSLDTILYKWKCIVWASDLYAQTISAWAIQVCYTWSSADLFMRHSHTGISDREY